MNKKIRNLIQLFISILILILINPNLQAESDEFNHYTSAYSYWLKEENLVETKAVVEKSLGHFFVLPQIALHKILSDPKSHWKLHTVSEYNVINGDKAPSYKTEIQTAKDGTKENIQIDGHHFIYRDDIAGPHLVVTFNSEYDLASSLGTVIISYSSTSYFSALELQAELQQYAKEKNPYQSSVIHISDQLNYQFKFLENVKDYKFSWDDLILDAETKSLTRQLSETYLSHFEEYKKLALKSQFGVLLAGPPGTGKSFLAQILISSIDSGLLKDQTTLVIVSARHLLNPSGIKTLFSAIKDLGSVCIFFEDIDLLGVKNRKNQPEKSDSQSQLILNELLNGIDGVVENNNVLLIGTTNRLNDVDEALLRSERFGFHLYFRLPSFAEREEFFNRFGKMNAVWAENLSTPWLVAKTDGFSGADILEIIGIAKRFAYVRKSWHGDSLLLTQEFFLEAIALVKEANETKVFGQHEFKNDSYTKSLKKLLFQSY